MANEDEIRARNGGSAPSPPEPPPPPWKGWTLVRTLAVSVAALVVGAGAVAGLKGIDQGGGGASEAPAPTGTTTSGGPPSSFDPAVERICREAVERAKIALREPPRPDALSITADLLSVAAGRLRSAGRAELGQALSDEATALEGLPATGDRAALERIREAGNQAVDIARREDSVQCLLLARLGSDMRLLRAS